jgi:multisubunit Na+/H+ antiporter MnhC subunit
LNDCVPELDKLILSSKLFSVTIDELIHEESSHPANSAAHKTPMAQIIEANFADRQISRGFAELIIGLVMLVLEFAFLPVFGYIHKTIVDGQGFYTDPMQYAAVQPMPILFLLTAIMITVGICFIAIGFIGKRKVKK